MGKYLASIIANGKTSTNTAVPRAAGFGHSVYGRYFDLKDVARILNLPTLFDASARQVRLFSRNGAFALIVVLAFIVLLTGLAIAYYSRTTSDRQA